MCTVTSPESLVRAPIDGPLSPAAIAALRAHPGFADAMRAWAHGLVTQYDGNRLLNQLLNDRGRGLFTLAALYLHYSRTPGDPGSGLTVGRMKDWCVERELCSRGRAEVMLGLLRARGYLAGASDPADRRLRVLVPTERLIALHRERFDQHFAAMERVLPQAMPARAALDEPRFMPAFTRCLGRHFDSGVRILGHSPELVLFAERNAGMIILFSLMLAGEADDTFPPTRPVPVSISGLGAKFGVSRKHVLTLLRDAEGEGYLQRTGERNDRLILLPRVHDAAQMFFASMFLFLAHCASEALAEIGPRSAVA
jgi:DNA-binding MarR family transcriptional regulator